MLNFPDSYVSYLVEFHAARDLFECHELLEEYWKEHPNDGLSDVWVGLIQLAVGLYHERRGNRRGAAAMLEQSLRRLGGADLAVLGIDGGLLGDKLEERIRSVKAGAGEWSYADFDIPIGSMELQRICEVICAARGLVWGAPSPLADDAVIHRHKLRDRSEVIRAREASLQAKKEKRGL